MPHPEMSLHLSSSYITDYPQREGDTHALVQRGTNGATYVWLSCTISTRLSFLSTKVCTRVEACTPAEEFIPRPVYSRDRVTLQSSKNEGENECTRPMTIFFEISVTLLLL